MPEGGKITPLSPGLVRRVGEGMRYIISGVAPDTWFGPMQPLAPLAPPEVAGRRFDYPVGYNLQYPPRSTEPVSFADLRALADNCDLLRLVIETRKDQIESLAWNIRPRDGALAGATGDTADAISRVARFLDRPDRVHDWSQWLRMLLEDLFVIDAPAIYVRRTLGGAPYALEIIDGATLKPLIDATGRQPSAPDPAYQQVLHGVPAVDYTAEELIYYPRNPRPNRIYGMSPVEQIVLTVNIAIRRALHQLEYYRSGNLPDALIGAPKEWTPDQIKSFQQWWDALFAGNLQGRRHGTFLPGDFKYQETKEPPLKDMYDDWLARIICFAFSVSPEAFVQHVNRATADTAQDRAIEEGLAPLMRWVKRLMDRIIQVDLAAPELEFAWLDDREHDPGKAATIDDLYVRAGIKSIDEIRDGLGLDPLGGAAAKPMVSTGTGYVPLDANAKPAVGNVAGPQDEG